MHLSLLAECMFYSATRRDRAAYAAREATTSGLDEKVSNDSDFGQKVMLDSDIGLHICGFLSSIRFVT